MRPPSERGGPGGRGERPGGFGAGSRGPTPIVEAARYGRYVGLLALLLLVLITLNTVLTKSRAGAGIAPGQRVPPFAVPLATGTLEGDADVARHGHEGPAGNRPACSLVGAQILNICQLYGRGPVVLALFVDGGACTRVLDELRALAPQFPEVGFAAVAIKGDRGALRRLVAARAPGFPVGFDRDGALAPLYKMVSCPQLTFVYPGGVVQSRALLELPSQAILRARVQRLLDAARARGWRAPPR